MSRHPYRRFRQDLPLLPEVSISEQGNIRSLHLGSSTVQSSMNTEHPAQLVLSYSQAMMAWLLFAPHKVEHILQIGLGGGSFVRYLDAYLPQVYQSVVEINPEVIAVARSLFELPFEGERFEIIEGDGAEYVKVAPDASCDVMLVDGFDGEQIVDDFVSAPFFAECYRLLREGGVFVTNWWQKDKRYPLFVERLQRVFGAVMAFPAQTHGNVAVLAFQSVPKNLTWETLLKRAKGLSATYDIDFCALVKGAKKDCVNEALSFIK